MATTTHRPRRPRGSGSAPRKPAVGSRSRSSLWPTSQLKPLKRSPTRSDAGSSFACSSTQPAATAPASNGHSQARRAMRLPARGCAEIALVQCARALGRVAAPGDLPRQLGAETMAKTDSDLFDRCTKPACVSEPPRRPARSARAPARKRLAQREAQSASCARIAPITAKLCAYARRQPGCNALMAHYGSGR